MWKMWAATLATVFILGFLYVGSTHRDRCIKAGNSGCSMLPWSGQAGGWGNSGLRFNSNSGGWGP